MDFPQQAKAYRTMIKGKVLIEKGSENQRWLPFGVVSECSTMYVQYVPSDWDGCDMNYIIWKSVHEILNDMNHPRRTYYEPMTKDDENTLRELK